MKISSDTPAIVTGAASGLGAAVAQALAERGAKVALFDLDETRGKALAQDLGGVFCAVDVGDAADVAAGFEAARAAHGQERVLVNCAGVGTSGRIVSKGVPHDAAAFEKTIRINLLGTFHCAALAAAGMGAGDPVTEDGERGVIVNTASVAAFDGQIGQLAYAASKAGVVGMTLPMARDLASTGVRVVTIAPGIFDTPMLQGLPDEVRTSLGNQVPFPARLGDPGEFANLAVHIVENQMLNGETIRLDGSIRMGVR